MKHLLLLAAVCAGIQGQNICSSIPLGLNIINGNSFAAFKPFPSSDWYTDISGAAVDSNSANYIMRWWDGGNVGTSDGNAGWFIQYTTQPNTSAISIPNSTQGRFIHVIDHNTPLVSISFAYPGDSDPGPYPIPRHPRASGSIGPYEMENYLTGGDQVVLILDKDKCVLYEIDGAVWTPWGVSAVAGAVWDLTAADYRQRPYFATSASVSGLQLFMGIIRKEELLAGTINHPIAATGMHSLYSHAWTNGASHHQYAGGSGPNTWNSTVLPFGGILRLKSSYNCTATLTGYNQIICAAAKKYGVVFYDGQGNSHPTLQFATVDGASNSGQVAEMFSDAGFNNSTNWEVVQLSTSPTCDPAYSCGHQPPTVAVPTVASFSVSNSSPTCGSQVTFSWSGISGAADGLKWILASKGPNVGLVGSAENSKTITAAYNTPVTYTLQVRNRGGNNAPATVTVQCH